MDEQQLKQWQGIELLLNTASGEVQDSSWYPKYQEFINHNELEVALDVLIDAGDELTVSPEYWQSLLKATELMGLVERLAFLEQRLRHTSDRKTEAIPAVLLAYLSSSKPMVCEFEISPFLCEFWEQDELLLFNREYEVPKWAPGYFGFGTSGGGEMFAIAPDGAVVCLPFIGMEPKVAMVLASSWGEFEKILPRG